LTGKNRRYGRTSRPSCASGIFADIDAAAVSGTPTDKSPGQRHTSSVGVSDTPSARILSDRGLYGCLGVLLMRAGCRVPDRLVQTASTRQLSPQTLRGQRINMRVASIRRWMRRCPRPRTTTPRRVTPRSPSVTSRPERQLMRVPSMDDRPPARTVRRVDRARLVHRAGRSGLCPPPHDRARPTSLRNPQRYTRAPRKESVPAERLDRVWPDADPAESV